MGNSSNKELTPQDLQEMRKNTDFGGSEIVSWYNKFHEEYPSGYMNKEDFVKLYKRLFPKGDSQKFAEYIFSSHDIDKSGRVNFREFLCILSVSKHGSAEEKLRWSFQMYDRDRDGSVSYDEAAEIIQAIAHMKSQPATSINIKQTVDEIFLHLDKNKDGYLSEVEFVDSAKLSANVVRMLTG